MAVSVGPASPLLPRSSISPPSPSILRNVKLSPWRYVKAKGHVLQLNSIQFQVRKTDQIANGVVKVTRRLIPSAVSEDQLACDELNSNGLEPENVHLVAEENSATRISFLPAERTEGKPGFVSFHGLPYQRRDENVGSSPVKEMPKIFWFIGPTVLVAFLVFPSLYLRRIFSTVFEDSLLTDFLILFFTEALFYTGVAIFILLIDHVWRPLQQISSKNYDWSNVQFGFRISSVATLVLSLIIPLVTMGMVWPWTGPAASATLAPYLVGLVVQFAFEQYARHRKSPAWPVIPVIFQVYRLHQLNRAAQLVTALSFSVRGVETTSQTMAINTSLGALLTVLQILGVICIWSLSNFLMRFLPTSEVIPDS